MSFMRILKHLLTPRWRIRVDYPARTLSAIESAIAASEKAHRGELRFAVEAGLPLYHLLSGQTARSRAAEVFSQLRVWDTEDNSGVLIYVQLVDRRVEILADRGIAARVPQAEWDAVCRRMEQAFARGEFEAGTLAAIEEIGTRLTRHFPSEGGGNNELPDRPVVL